MNLQLLSWWLPKHQYFFYSVLHFFCCTCNVSIKLNAYMLRLLIHVVLPRYSKNNNKRNKAIIRWRNHSKDGKVRYAKKSTLCSI